MMAGTHTLVSVSTTAVLCSLTHQPPETAGILLAGAAATASLPDVDQHIPRLEHRGPATHSLWAAGLFTWVAIVALALLPLGPELALPFDLGRVSLAPGDFALPLGLGAGAGVLFHQLADALTLSGVPLLWPLDRDGKGGTVDRHLLPPGLRIRTDGPFEKVFSILFIAAIAYYFGSTYAGH